jgi:hypothetical protein
MFCFVMQHVLSLGCLDYGDLSKTLTADVEIYD